MASSYSDSSYETDSSGVGGYDIGCPGCHAEFDNYSLQYCHFCNRFVKPVPKDPKTKRPVRDDDLVDSGLVCAECDAAVLCRGGHSDEEPLMHAWCFDCQRECDITYADGREAFCCKRCRRERPVSASTYRHVGADGVTRFVRVFRDWCDTCDEATDTGNVDTRWNETVLVCQACRWEWDDDVAYDEECPYCEDDDDEPADIDA